MHRVLYFLRDIGLLADVPTTPPPPGKVLARSVCFLHDRADNPRGFLLYADGFACVTRGCHKERGLGHNLEGLIRHMAYRLTGEEMSWRDAWWFARQNPDKFKELVGDKVRQGGGDADESPPVNWTKEQLLACLDVPSPYFLKRGFLPETLAYFGIGTCVRLLPDGKANLIGWPVVPILHRPHLPPLGYTARNPRYGDGVQEMKWLNKVNKSKVLFNHGNCSNGPLLITEGVPNVLRFWEAGLSGAVATLGNSFSEDQYGLFLCHLDRKRKVYVAADDDDPGRAFAEEVVREVGRVCDPQVVFPPNGRNDFGDCTADEIRGMGLR